MRVLNSLSDSRIAGPQLRALRVAKQLRESGIQTIFLLPDGSDEFEKLAKNAGFDVTRPGIQRIQPPKQITANLRYISNIHPAEKRIRRIIKNQDINVVHASMTLNFQAAIAAWRSQAPLAWFFNDTLIPWPLNRITGKAAQILADDISIAADAVHEHFFPESVKTRTVYPPVDTDEFNPQSVSNTNKYINKLDLHPEDPIVGTVGNINPIKGHIYLLQSISQVEEEFGSVSVLIAGSILDSRKNYYENLLQLRSKLDLENTVHFIGQESNVPQFLDAIDLFAFPSVKEACPMAVLEAMAMELPIVSTNAGGIPEQISDGTHGWLVPTKDSNTLANVICQALTSPDDAQQRAKAARKRAEKAFSVQKCAQRHKDMYESVL